MKIKEVFDWFADRPLHFCALSFCVSVMWICLAACVFSISSCAATCDEHYYKHRTESNKTFWEKTKKWDAD